MLEIIEKWYCRKQLTNKTAFIRRELIMLGETSFVKWRAQETRNEKMEEAILPSNILIRRMTTKEIEESER